ncbi:hypothetical protein B0H13DRAFT_2277703 [Mycena leptocephala]|nr:hypothetical protein B0H13DRAFT_2277703 [Mycena leptocephala]
MIAAKCKIEAQNRLYNNPVADPPCKCTTCIADPPPLPRVDCNCSGCVPENIPAPAKPPPAPKPIDKIPKHKRLSKLQRTHGTARLVGFQRDIWRQADIAITSFLPPEAFLLSSLIKVILDVYDSLTSQDAVTELVKTHKRLDDHHGALFQLVVDLKPEFRKIAADRKAELAAARKKTKAPVVSDEDELMDTASSGEDSEIEPQTEPEASKYVLSVISLQG